MKFVNPWLAVAMVVVSNGLSGARWAHAEQETFDVDFRKPFAPTRLRLIGGEQPAKYCTFSSDGVRCTIPPGTNHVSTCGIDARFVLRGNFEIIADYKLLEVPQPDIGQGAGVKISIKDTRGEWASLQRIHLKKNGNVFSAHRAVKQQDDKYQHSSEVQPAKSDHGRLKFVRDGDQLTYFVIDGDGTDFTELRSELFGNGELAQIYLASQTGGAKTGIDVVWTELHVRADSIHQPSLAGGKRQQRQWPYLLMAGGTLIFVVLAVMLVRRSHKSDNP